MNQLLIDLKNKLNPIVELIKDKKRRILFRLPASFERGRFTDLSRNRAIF